MALLIQTTGLEQYAPGGQARIKVLNIGGPGVGKTRWASFFPQPIYADCEAGLASVADRRVPFVSIRTSQDMLDLLHHVKLDGRLPKDKRTIETVVIDTLDAYQRKLKAEWMDANRKEAFSGWEAWGWLAQKMSLLLTRLLNLDVNVVVNVHHKDKTTKDDVTGVETHELMLQLSGEISDTAYNDFDLVGWTGVYWEAVDGQRVQRRGITFKPTPDKPFLKDRLHVTPEWLPIEFATSDYVNLFSRIQAKVAELAPGEALGEIAASEDEPSNGARVVAPAVLSSGPVPEQKTVEVPLAQLDKPTLAKKARELGVTTLPDGSPIKGNTLKAELIAAIEHRRSMSPARQELERLADRMVTPAPGPDAAPSDPAPAPAQVQPAGPAVPRQAAPPAVEQVAEGLVDTTTGELLAAVAPLGERALQLDEEDRREQARQAGVILHDGPPAVLESVPTEPTIEEAVATVAEKLGGQVIAEEKTGAAAEALARRTEKPTAKPAAACEDCGKDLAGEKSDYVKLAWIKYRKKLCEICYQKRKAM